MRILILTLMAPALTASATAVSAQNRLPPCPGPFDAATWTNCLGTYAWYDGQEYTGHWKDGQSSGQGTTTFRDGGKYVGEFKDGKFHGLGTFAYPNGNQYVGAWMNGMPNGQGTATYRNGEKHAGEWKDGKLYAGEYKDGKPDGRGTMRLPDGRKYVGEFRDGRYNGRGTYTWPSGDRYVGEYRDDKRNGRGTYTYADGEKYVGQFRDNESHGNGTHTYPDGRKYVGEFKDGKFHGKGTYTNPDGRKYTGEWSDGKPTTSRPREGDNVVIARAIGLRPIGEQPSSGGDELRIWFFSHRVTRSMLILRDGPAGIDGEFVIWWGQVYGRWVDDPTGRAQDLSAVIRKENAQRRASIKSQWNCARHVVGALFEACRVSFRRQPDWSGLLRELVREGVWDLPDSRTLPRQASPAQVFDAGVLVVEVRRGGIARSYSYVLPSPYVGPEVRNAERILSLFGEFERSLEALR